ncbi:MAG: MFS transporter [Pseudomonadota bacterium]
MFDRAIIILAIAQTLVWGCVFYIFPALLLWWESGFGWSRSVLTGAVTMAILATACSSVIAGRLIDKGLSHIMMPVCTVVAGVAIALLSQVMEVWQFYALWLVAGIAMGGCLYDPCFALLTRARGRHARQGIIVITLFAGFASTIAFPTAHTLSDMYGWRMAASVFAGVTIFITAPLMRIGASMVEAEARRAPEVQSEPEIKDVSFLKLPQFWCLAIGFSFAALLHGTVLHHLLPILADKGIDRELSVLAASFFGPMQVAGRLMIMATGHRVANHVMTAICFCTLIVSVVFLMVSGVALIYLVAFVVSFGAAHGITNIIRPLLARDILGRSSFGAKSGYLAMAYIGGGAIAPYLGSLIWLSGGYNLVLLCLIGVGGIGLVLLMLAQHYATRDLKEAL